MKQLIISNYDSECDFTWIIIDNGTEVARGYKSIELKRYALYDEYRRIGYRLDKNTNQMSIFDYIDKE